MAVTYTWSIEAHKHDTSTEKYVSNVAYRVKAKEGDYSALINSNIILTKPSTVIAYDTFMGTGDTNLVNAVKAQLGATEVTAKEKEAKDSLDKVKAPSHVWVQGPQTS